MGRWGDWEMGRWGEREDGKPGNLVLIGAKLNRPAHLVTCLSLYLYLSTSKDLIICHHFFIELALKANGCTKRLARADTLLLYQQPPLCCNCAFLLKDCNFFCASFLKNFFAVSLSLS